MSLAVWSIALLHGFFVLIVADMTKSRAAIVCAAIVAAAVGLLTGDPVYIFIDLLCVGAATIFCWKSAEKIDYRTPSEIRAAEEIAYRRQLKEKEDAEKLKKTLNEIFQFVIYVCAIGLFIYFKFWQSSPAPTVQTSHAEQQPQPQPQPVISAARAEKVNSYVNLTEKSNAVQKSHSKNQTAKQKQKQNAKRHPIEECLEIPNEQEMTRCLARIK